MSKAGSSKGNQLKFQNDNVWIKADFLGYEGAAEYMSSEILQHSNIGNFVPYALKEVHYMEHVYTGCESQNFLKPGQRLITAERLLKSQCNISFESLLNGLSLEQKIKTFVNQITEMTGLVYFGEYLTALLEFDAFVLNEDRHFHNIAVIQNEDLSYCYCPVFDNGAGFLSDTTYDYPTNKNTIGLISNVTAKPFSTSFDNQVECCQKLYGKQLQIMDMNLSDVINCVEQMYGNTISTRISEIYEHQRYMYQELFVKELTSQLDWDTWEHDAMDIEI